jgi:hypothetical protein
LKIFRADADPVQKSGIGNHAGQSKNQAGRIVRSNYLSNEKPGRPEKRIGNMENGLRFSFLVLGAQVLVTAFAAAGCADRVACVTVHAYFYVE